MGCIVYNGRNLSRFALSGAEALVFERRYGSLVSSAKGALVIYYAARATHNGGNYYAVARIGDVFPHPAAPTQLFATVSEYGRFPAGIPAFGPSRGYENALFGRNWHSMVQRTVRAIPDAEALAILEDVDRPGSPVAHDGLAEDSARYEHEPRGFDVVGRAKRWLQLRQQTRLEYGCRCSFTKCGQKDRSGEPEAECCHIWPVHEGGPDAIWNAILLGRSIHWAFDKHLISLEDNFRFVITDGLEPQYRQLLNPDGYARIPENPQSRPSLELLRVHRRKTLAGRG